MRQIIMALNVKLLSQVQFLLSLQYSKFHRGGCFQSHSVIQSTTIAIRSMNSTCLKIHIHTNVDFLYSHISIVVHWNLGALATSMLNSHIRQSIEAFVSANTCQLNCIMEFIIEISVLIIFVYLLLKIYWRLKLVSFVNSDFKGRQILLSNITLYTSYQNCTCLIDRFASVSLNTKYKMSAGLGACRSYNLVKCSRATLSVKKRRAQTETD